MKDNKFFELFNDIDSKFIHEAEEKIDEENASETVIPQIVSGSAPKRKIYPALLKTAACLAAVGVAAGAFIAVGSGTPDTLSPNGSGQLAPEASDTSDISETLYTEEPPVDTSGISDTEEAVSESGDVTGGSYTGEIIHGNITSFPDSQPIVNELNDSGIIEWYDDNTERYLAVQEWNSREFVRPLSGQSLPEGYSPKVDGSRIFSSVFIPSEDPDAEVMAVSDGEVVYIGNIDPRNSLSDGGNVIIIKHNDYVYTNYCRLAEKEGLKVGDKVTAGEVIGHVDSRVIFYILDRYSQEEQEKLISGEGIGDIKGEYGFTFEVRAAETSETDIGRLMGTFIRDENEAAETSFSVEGKEYEFDNEEAAGNAGEAQIVLGE